MPKTWRKFASHIVVVWLLIGGSVPEAFADSRRFSLDASLRIDGVYDSNIFLTTTNVESDFLASVNPVLRSAFLLRWGEVNLGVQPKVLLPLSNFSDSSLEKFQHDYYLDFKTFITERITVTVSDRFATVGGNIALPADQPSNTIDTNTSRLDINYKIPFALRTDLEFGIAGSRVFVFDFPSDRTQGDAVISIKRQVGPRLNVGLLNRGAIIIYDESSLQNVIIYGAHATSDYELLEDFFLSIPVGFQLLFLEAGTQELAFGMDVSLKGPLTKRTTIEAGYKRGFTVDAVGNAFERWAALAEAEYELNSRAKVTGGLEYSQYLAETASATEDALFESRIEFNYRLTARLYSNLGGTMFFNRGELQSNDLESFRGFVGLTYVFSKQE